MLSVDCLSRLWFDQLPSVWSTLGDEATIDVIPLFGVPFAGKELTTGIDGGGIIDVDWWCLALDKIPRELFGLSLGASRFAVDAEMLFAGLRGPELSRTGLTAAFNKFAHDASLRFCRSPDGVEPDADDDGWGWW